MTTIYMAFDESITKNRSICMLSCAVFDNLNFKDDVEMTIRQIKSKPWYKTTSFPHYTEDSYALRTLFVDEIRRLNFKAYVTLQKGKQCPTNTQNIYDILLIEFLKPLIRKYIKRFWKDIKIILYFENTSSKKDRDQTYLQKLLNQGLDNLPCNIEVNVLLKSEDWWITAIPDYICGCLSEFLLNPNSEKESSNGNAIFTTLISNMGRIKTLEDGESHFYHLSKWEEREKFIEQYKWKFSRATLLNVLLTRIRWIFHIFS